MTRFPSSTAKFILAATLLTATLAACTPDPGTPPVVNPPPATNVVTAVTVTPASGSLEVGKTLALSATALNSSGAAVSGAVITWTSSDPAVASVTASGEVTGVKAGSASIQAASGTVQGNAVTVTVTAASVPPPVTLPATGPQEITSEYVAFADISRGGTIYYFGFDSKALADVSRVIRNGMTTTLPAMSGGYAPTTAYAGVLDAPCVDDEGNVTVRTESRATGTRVYQTHHYAFAAGSYAALPLESQAPVVVACKGGKVLLGDDSASSGREFNTVSAYTWAQGDAAVTALPVVSVGACVGCNATDTDWKGKVLYDRGLLDGAAYTLSTPDTFKARRLLPDGTAVGHHNGGSLSSWTPGTAAVTLPGQPAPTLTLLDVNDHGDLLAASKDPATGKVSVWLRKAGTWTAVDPGPKYTFSDQFSDYSGLTNDGRFLAKAVTSTAPYRSLVLF